MAHPKNTLGPILDRNGVYHYRRRIPGDIRAALRAIDSSGMQGPKQDKREEKKRLGRDKVRAERLWTEHDQRTEARWAELRKTDRRVLTITEREALAGDIYRLWLKRCPETHWLAGQNAAMWLGLMEEQDGDIPKWSHNQTDRDEFVESMHGADIDKLLADRGLRICDPTRWDLLERAQRAAKIAVKYAMKRKEGDRRPDPEAGQFPKWPNAEVDTLTGLHGLWVKARRHAKPDTHASFGSCIKKFIAFLGHDVVADITAEDIMRWTSFLRDREHLSDIRIRDGYFAAIRTVMNSARNSGLIQANPCDGIRLEAEPLPRVREKDLRDEEIYAILKASLEKHEHVSDDVAAARRWVPWLLAYTGARVAEITRLEGHHIVKQSGIYGIDIQQSKNGRPRIVPIHRHLIEQGFLQFVEERKKRPLFFARGKLESALVIHKTRAEGLGEWARKAAKITVGEVAPQHGWRHRFKTECRTIAMDPEVRLYLQGHAFKSEGEKYGFFPLHVTAPWMSLFPTFEVGGGALKMLRVADSASFIAAAAATGRLPFMSPSFQDDSGATKAPVGAILH